MPGIQAGVGGVARLIPGDPLTDRVNTAGVCRLSSLV